MIAYVVVLLLCSTLSLTAAEQGPLPCEESQACPENSACKKFDTNQTCLCNVGYQPSDDGFHCLKVVELTGDCTQTGTTCRRGPWGSAACMNGRCGCPVGYIQVGNTACVMDTMVGVGVSLLGQECSETRLCQFPRSQTCHRGKCKCREYFKMAGEDFRSAMPLVDECIPEYFVIETASRGSH